MCSCVPGEVLRQCSAANLVIYAMVPSFHKHSVMTVLSLKKNSHFIFHAHIALKSADSAVCTPMCILY